MNIETVKNALQLSNDAYTEVTMKVNGVECYIVQDEKFQWVAFRGTDAANMISQDGWKDVIRDIRAFPWYDPRVGWSHAGFLKGARGIVDCGLFGLLRREKPVIFTGHSLGGALAINAAAMMTSMGFNVYAAITFGSPKTFLSVTSKRWKSRNIVFEYVNEGDPIPYTPLRFFGYRHVNKILTSRKRDGILISKNHLLKFYNEAFKL